MICEVIGDLLLSKAKVYAHGIGPDDDFRSGLAFGMRQRWPAMYREFRHASHIDKMEPGEVWTWNGPGIVVANLLTQTPVEPDEDALFAADPTSPEGMSSPAESDPAASDANGHNGHNGHATVESVDHALRALRTLILKQNYPSVAMPRLATGAGGLPWREVKPLVTHHLGDLEARVYLYTHYMPGQLAREED